MRVALNSSGCGVCGCGVCGCGVCLRQFAKVFALQKRVELKLGHFRIASDRHLAVFKTTSFFNEKLTQLIIRRSKTEKA